MGNLNLGSQEPQNQVPSLSEQPPLRKFVSYTDIFEDDTPGALLSRIKSISPFEGEIERERERENIRDNGLGLRLNFGFEFGLGF